MARIMLIDDDVELADNTADLLRHSGHTVSVLYTTGHAIGAIVHDHPDVIILDVMFPGNPVGGFDLAREIRHSDTAARALPIILLTNINQELPVNFSASDIDPEWMPVEAFITKPVSITILNDTITRLLQARVPNSKP